MVQLCSGVEGELHYEGEMLHVPGVCTYIGAAQVKLVQAFITISSVCTTQVHSNYRESGNHFCTKIHYQVAILTHKCEKL